MAHCHLAYRPHPVALPTIEIGLYRHQLIHRDPARRWLRPPIVRHFASAPGAMPD